MPMSIVFYLLMLSMPIYIIMFHIIFSYHCLYLYITVIFT